MHSDSAFRIGKTHSVCQDYALSYVGLDGAEAIAVVSDGCSGAPDTDIGARLIARACVKQLRGFTLFDTTAEALADCTMWRADAWRQRLELEATACEATCLAIASRGNLLKAYLYGDGWLFAERLDGTIEFIHSWFRTAPRSVSIPLYLSYIRQLGFNRSAVLEEFGVESWEWVKSRARLSRDGVWTEVSETNEPAEPSCLLRGELTFPAQDYRLMGVLSDGADSFMRTVQTATSKQVIAVPFPEIAAKLLRFPDVDGPFATSRLKQFEKWCDKENVFHSDDLAMAAITFSER
jgi:hypothetical protein